MSWQRRLVAPFEKVLGVDIVRRGRAAVTLERQYLRRFLKYFEVDCVFDVGANAGQYAEMVRSLGYDGPIISFEPIPAVAEVLTSKARSDPHWFVERVALDREAREAVFRVTSHTEFSSLHPASSAETSLFEQLNATSTTIKIKTRTLPPIFKQYKSELQFLRPFLKLDTQGHDVAIVQGATEILNEFVGLQSELAIKRLYEDQPDFTESLALYRSMGFELGALVPNNSGQFPLLYEVDCIMVNGRADGSGGSGGASSEQR